MMNANVRRLVFDLSPRRAVWGVILGWFILGATVAMGASSHGDYSAGAFIGFWSSLWSLTCVTKFSAWRNLPISITDMKTSQFWVLLGFPFLIILTSNISGLMISGSLYKIHHYPTNYLAITSIQICIPISLNLLIYASALSSSFWKYFFVSIILSMFLIFLLIGLYITIDISPANLILKLAIVFGALAVLACLSALVWNQYLPLISPGKVNQSWTTRPSGPAPYKLSSAYSPPSGRPGAWRLFASSIRRIAPYGGVAFCLVGLALITPKSGPFLVFERPMSALALAPLFSSGLALLTLWEPQRVCGGFPISALGRTAAMQLVVPTFVLPAWGMIFAVAAFYRPEAVTSGWWIGCGFTCLVALSFGAVSLPAGLRFGRIGMALTYGVSSFVTGMIGFQPTKFGDRWALEGRLSPGDITTIGALTLVLILSWIWTYAELALWRKAYQTQGRIPVRWRGGGV